MTDNLEHVPHTSVGAWAKRCYFAGRALIDSSLRPYDLGSTQWYVLWHLATVGPTMQRDLAPALNIERATLSGVVATLVRKRLVSQSPGDTDQRQRLLQLTDAGRALWNGLPDLTFIHRVAFEGMDPAAIETAIAVLKTATERLENYAQKGIES